MKKFMTLMLCLGATSVVFGQATIVKQAKQLSGKPDKLQEARGLIKQAMENSETNNDANTYYVAGIIELDAYDNALKAKMINPNDPSASTDVMGGELLGAYNYFLQALPLDSLPNEKGQVKPKYSKDIYNKIKGHQSDFYDMAVAYYNDKKFYPEAYDAFTIYANLPQKFNLTDTTIINKDQVANAFFNAGIAANQGEKVEKSGEAFRSARLAGYKQPEAAKYEISCWAIVAQNDSTRMEEMQTRIQEAAKGGIAQFGIEDPYFLNNLVNAMVGNNQTDAALDVVNQYMDKYPENAHLYGVRGYLFEVLGQDDKSEADFRKGASMPNADFETLKSAGVKLYRLGAAKLNDINGNSPEDNAAREQIKQNYFIQAQEYAKKADQLQPGDAGVQSLLDSVDYALTTFFN